MNWGALAAILLGAAVMLGAFGAHGLRERLDAHAMGVYERAVFYHFIHALGLLLVSVLSKTGALARSAADWIGWMLFAGILLFSGSLYVLAISGVQTLGAITPFGGLLLIAAWFSLAFFLLRRKA